MASRRAVRSQLRADPTSRFQKFCVAAPVRIVRQVGQVADPMGQRQARRTTSMLSWNRPRMRVTEQGEPWRNRPFQAEISTRTSNQSGAGYVTCAPPIVRIVVGLVPDVPCALFVGVFRISLPHRTSTAAASGPSARRVADPPLFESHVSLLAISSSRFARSTSFCEMPPAS